MIVDSDSDPDIDMDACTVSKPLRRGHPPPGFEHLYHNKNMMYNLNKFGVKYNKSSVKLPDNKQVIFKKGCIPSSNGKTVTVNEVTSKLSELNKDSVKTQRLLKQIAGECQELVLKIQAQKSTDPMCQLFELIPDIVRSEYDKVHNNHNKPTTYTPSPPPKPIDFTKINATSLAALSRQLCKLRGGGSSGSEGDDNGDDKKKKTKSSKSKRKKTKTKTKSSKSAQSSQSSKGRKKTKTTKSSSPTASPKKTKSTSPKKRNQNSSSSTSSKNKTSGI